MEYRRYESVMRSFSDSSSDSDKSEDELPYDEDCHESKFFGQGETGSRLFRRWFLNIIDLPNSLTNRLKDWLRAPPGSRGSTSDKSSGTNSVRPSEIHLTGSAESDYDDHEKYNRLRHGDNARKNYRAPGAHRPPKNHHVYHLYKQNEMGFQRAIGGQRDYSTSWLQRNGRFSSSPVLVLPRLDPDTGQPIFHPRSYHSRTATERRTVTRRNENWRSDIWELKTNRYTRLRGDKEGTEDLANGQSSSKPKTAGTTNNHFFNDGQLDPQSVELKVTASTAFRETISMRLNIEDSQSYGRRVSVDENNSHEIKKKDTKERQCTELPVLPRVPSLTQSNVEELLRSLRQKINSLNTEKKFNDPLGHVSGLIRPESGSRRREHLFSTRWQGKSDLFGKETRTTYGEARTSFTERIQDMWIQERTPSQWAVLHRHGNHVSTDANSKAQDGEDVAEEKKINRCVVGKNIRIDGKEDFTEEKRNNCNIADINMKIDGKEDFTEEKKIKHNIASKSMKIDGCEHIVEEKEMNCNIGDKNMKIDGNEDFTKEKGNNRNIDDKNIKIDETQGFTNEKGNNRNIDDKNMKIDGNEDFPEKKINSDTVDENMNTDGNDDCQEKKADCTGTEKNGRGDDEALISSFSSSSDNEISKPTVCHVAVQYSVPEANASKELHRPRALQSENNDDKSEIQILLLLKPLDTHNEITVDSTQFPWSREIQEFAQSRTDSSTGFASPSPFLAFEPRASEASEKKLNHFKESAPNNNSLFPENAPRSMRDKISKLLFLGPNKTRLRNRLTRLPKIGLGTSIRFSRASFLRKKSRFPKQFRAWLAQKIPSDRRSTPFSRSNLGCMGIIFKCAEKTSESSLPQEFPAIARPTPPIRRRKRRARSSNGASPDAMSETEKNTELILDAKSTRERAEEIGVDSSAIEPGSGSNCKRHGERSMTTLSVTTSNSTNIPLQLLGSTSDTTVVPSHDSQDDFKPRVADSPGSVEITTRKREIETCEETDDCRTDLSSPALRTDEGSKIIEFGDVLKMADGPRMKNGFHKKSSRVDPARKREIETCEETDDCRTDLSSPALGTDETSKIFEFGDVLKMADGSGSRMKNGADKKSGRVDPARKGLRSREKSPVVGRRRREPKREKTIVNKKHSLDIENLPSRKGHSKKIEKIMLSDKNAGERRANSMRLNRRESIIDIAVDESLKSEPKRQSSEIRDKSDASANRKSVPNAPKDEPSDNRKASNNVEKSQKGQVRSLHSRGFYPELMPAAATKKLRQRADSPMIPRKASDSPKRRSAASGGSSFIPVDIGNSKCLSIMSKSDENKSTREKNSFMKENRNSLNGGTKWQPTLNGDSKYLSFMNKSDENKSTREEKSFEEKNQNSLNSETKWRSTLNGDPKYLSFMSKSDENKSIREEKSSEEKNQNSLNSETKWRTTLNGDSKYLSFMSKSDENKSTREQKSFEEKGRNSLNFGAKWRPTLNENSKCLSTPSKSDENKSAREENSFDEKGRNSLNAGAKWRPTLNENSKCSIMNKSTENKSIREKNSFDEKDRNSLNPGAKWRPSLKKPSKSSAISGVKKISNHRVHFELEKSSSKEVESSAALKQKNDGKCHDHSKKIIYGSPLREIDNKLLVRRIKSSLKNGMPLKRITIVDPRSVSGSGSEFDRGGRSGVEKSVVDRARKSRADTRNLTSRAERTRPISRADKESVERTCPRRAPSLSGQIPKLAGSFEKRHPKENKLSYRSRSRRGDKSDPTDYPVQRTSGNSRESIVDLAAIRERVENEILERTSRTSGTEDSDCAIVLIKAINSTMEMSDLP